MKKATILILVLLLIAGCGPFKVNKSSTYLYSNGDSEFKVTKVAFDNYIGYQIEIYFPGNHQPYYINLRYDPLSLEDINIDRKIFHTLRDDNNVYITIDPDANLTSKATIAALEIDKFIDNKYFMNIAVNSSMTKPYHNFAVRTCENATKESSVIWLKKSDKNQISLDNNCIIIEGKTEDDLIRGADRLSLYLIGIMP